MPIKDSLMTAADTLDDITARLTTLSSAFLQYSLSMPPTGPDDEPPYDPLIEWQEAQTEPEPAPPEAFVDEILRMMTRFTRESQGLQERFQALPGADDMPTAFDILDQLTWEMKEFTLAMLWTTHGQPTRKPLVEYRYLDREPVSAILDGNTLEAVCTPEMDDSGRQARHWRLETRPRPESLSKEALDMLQGDLAVDRATPPAWFMKDAVRMLTAQHRQAVELYGQFRSLPDSPGMETLDDILGYSEQLSKELAMAAIWTMRGQPTAFTQVSSTVLEREPVKVTLDGFEYSLESPPGPAGSPHSRWDMKVKRAT